MQIPPAGYKIELYKNGIDQTKEVGDEIIRKTEVYFTSDETMLRNAKFHIDFAYEALPDEVYNNCDLNKKKKNGSLHKGRIQRIAHMNFTDEDGETYVAVAKNDSDTKISIEVRMVGINTTWIDEPDLFDSTDLFFG